MKDPGSRAFELAAVLAILVGACAGRGAGGSAGRGGGVDGTGGSAGAAGTVAGPGGAGAGGAGGPAPSSADAAAGEGGAADAGPDAGPDAALDVKADAGPAGDATAEVVAPQPDATAGERPDPGTEGDGVREIGPTYKDAPEISAHGAPKGTLIRFVIQGGTSQLFPKAPDRGVAVYVPARYVAGTSAPVLVAQDGDNFYDFVALVSNTLDNLIAAGKVPPIVAVFANNGGGDAQGSERGLEYDTLSGVYAEWVDRELLPRVEAETKAQVPARAVTFTRDSEGRAALGGSSGGAASFSMMWWHPELFRRAVTYSGSFVAQEFPINPEHPLGAWNYHEDKDNDDGGIIAKTDPVKPIRVWLECGSADNDVGSTQYPHYDMQFANQHMELKLARKGYHVHLDHGAGAGHVDGRVVRQTLPEALLWVWRGYPIR
jgi:enterochelin esterase family protein